MIRANGTVFVVDDDLSVREAVGSLLRSVGLRVRTFASAPDFLASERPEAPSCLVLDVGLSGLNGLELQKKLADTDLDLPIIFITGHGDIPMSVRAMKAGAVEFLTKPFRDRDLLRAIEESIERDRAVRKKRSQSADVHLRHDSLTARERQVMALVVRGLLNKQIAGELGTSEITVKVHRRHVMLKMGASSLAELVRMAERLRVSSN
jgi:FixJ family two-component response regulator